MKKNLSIFRNVILWGTFLITFGCNANSLAQTQCPVDNRLVKMPASDDKYYLPENYIFKVKFDAPISTDTYKTGSIVQFSVVENVLGIKLPEFETEAELTVFKDKLNDIINSYQLGIDIILEYYPLEIYETLKANIKEDDDVKAEKLKTLNNDRAKKLEELYVMEAKSIEHLFFKNAYPEVTPEIEENFNFEVLKIEAEFKSKIKGIRNDDSGKKAQVEKLQRENFEKLKPLVEPEKNRLEAFGRVKKETLNEVKEEIEKNLKKKTGEVEEKFNEDISKIKDLPDTDPFKKVKIKELVKAKTKELEKLETGKAESLKKLKTMPEIVTVIPEDSKGFGKVERAKRQAPLFLNYKARISVVLDYVLLTNGDCIPVEIKETPDDRLYNGKETELGGVIDCKSDGLVGKKCIKGRRPRFNLISPIISGMAAVATVLLDDSTAQALAGVTAVNQLTKDDLGSIINGADSTISDKLIYEVLTTESRIGTIKKEEKK